MRWNDGLVGDGDAGSLRSVLARSALTIEHSEPLLHALRRRQLARLSREELLRARSWAAEHDEEPVLRDIERQLAALAN